ncbi:MAG: hypothetical protein ACOY82_06930 [Pseudomonadota bacterium]
MSKHPICTALAAVLLAFGMTYGGNADAAWRVPKATTCNASTLGASSTTVNPVYNANGTLAYTDYATYLCTTGGWLLVDVTRCYPNGNCVPL